MQLIKMQASSNFCLNSSSDQVNEVTIYYNGHILTMDEALPKAKSIVIKNGVIFQIFKHSRLTQIIDHLEHTDQQINCKRKLKVIDLHHKWMLPAFYDAHSHLCVVSVQSSLGLEIASPPLGTVTSIPQLIQRIKEKAAKTPKGQVIYGMSYNDLGLLPDKKHPNRYELDAAVTDPNTGELTHPVLIAHVSTHMLVCNSWIIRAENITSETEVKGGVVDKFPNGEPTGLLKQTAMGLVSQYRSKFYETQYLSKVLKLGIQKYKKTGVTTAQEGYMATNQIPTLQAIPEKESIDIRGYLNIWDYLDLDQDRSKRHIDPNQTKMYKTQGVKIVLDGSIQGYTAFLNEPYFVQPSSPESELFGDSCCSKNHWHSLSKQIDLHSSAIKENSYRGFPIFQQEEVNDIFDELVEKEIDVICHCNGDAAIQQMLDAVFLARLHHPTSNSRLVINHAQTITEKQIDSAKQLDIILSFFPGHTYYWGYDHLHQFLGPIRAPRIDPIRSALLKKVKFTLHNDAPIVPQNMFEVIWSAVHREMYAGGAILGEDQRISVHDALKAVTIHSAYQGHQENSKGSITVGKIADLIILQSNPEKIKEMSHSEVASYSVLETIKEGKRVYRAVG